MIEWQPIETAPKDGSMIRVACEQKFPSFTVYPYPITSKFYDGKWTAEVRKGEWCSFEPQPTHWQPIQDCEYVCCGYPVMDNGYVCCGQYEPK